jgi:radical SAM superfamily enzyme YgiQ (UPF0313 family)
VSTHILLIYPEVPETFWSFRHALKFIGKRAAFPPLGLLTVAAMLPAHWEKRLADLNLRSLSEEDLSWADVVMVSGMTIQKKTAREAIKRCREAGLPVVAGGPLFTTEADEFPEVDHLVLDEAEVTLPPFLADWEAGVPQRVYRSDVKPCLSLTPIPAWELADVNAYASMSVQYSRGCPFQCEFCNVTALFGHRPRVKPVSRVIEELDLLRRLGWKGKVFFVDDNFIGNKKHLRQELLPALTEWQRRGHSMPFYTEASINLADDPALMRAMREAGFESVFVGIETPEDEALVACGKKQNTSRDLVADIHRIQAEGLEVQAGFIVGFDSDTTTIFRRQFEFIQKSGIAVAMVGMLQAVRGTRLHDRLSEAGRIKGGTSGDNVDGSTNIIPTMGLEALQDGYRQLLASIYSPRPFYARLKTFLRGYRVPEVRERLGFTKLMALFRSMFVLGVVGPERFHYWHVLLWTLIRRPELLSNAVSLAIFGHHFRKVCVEDLAIHRESITSPE